MGYFQLSDDGPYVNEFAWNKVANMLYLESPAGSGQRSGFSTCIQGGKAVDCEWDDSSQGEAYAHTLQAFQKAFPEFSKNDLYLTGESYFGQYGPNIAHFIVNNAPFSTSLNLKGLALGNACWGGSATEVDCNGPNSDQNDVDMYWGKGLVSKKLYEQVQKTCKWPDMVSGVPRHRRILSSTFDLPYQPQGPRLREGCGAGARGGRPAQCIQYL